MDIVITIRDTTHDGSTFSPLDFLDAGAAAVQRVKHQLPIDDGVFLVSVAVEKDSRAHVDNISNDAVVEDEDDERPLSEDEDDAEAIFAVLTPPVEQRKGRFRRGRQE